MKKIILCPFYYEKTLLSFLREKNNFFDVKFIDKESILRSYFGEFKSESILFLIKHYNLSYVVAKNYLKFLPFLNENNCDDDKSKTLLTIKNKLVEKGYFLQNKYTLNLIKNKEVEIIGYSNKDVRFNGILDELNCKYTYVENNHELTTDKILTFDTHEDEIHDLFIKICDLLKDGVDINDIFLYGVPKEYETILKRFSNFYHVPINGYSSLDLKSFSFGKEFFKKYTLTKNFDETILYLDEIYQDDKNYLSFKNALISEKDDELSFEQQLDLFESGLKAEIKFDIYDKAVTILNDLTYLNNKYIFILNFSQGCYPKVKDDNDYLPNEIKQKHHLLTTTIENSIAKDEMLAFFHTNNHFYFSSCHRINGNKMYPSFLKEPLGLKEVKGKLRDYDYSYDVAKINLIKLEDIRYHYREYRQEYFTYKNTIKANYRSFDNSFKPFEAVEKDKNIRYSYSSAKKYAACPFSYYLEKVLYLSSFEGNFFTNLGTQFHALLETSLKDPNADFESTYNTYFTSEVFSEKELVLCLNLKPNIEEAFNAVRLQLKQITNPRVELEKDITIRLNEHAWLNGKMDKVIISDNKFLSIVDYKTTNKETFDPSKLQYGLCMQLPTYALLASEDENLKSYQVGGLYINVILPTNSKDDILKVNDVSKYLKWQGRSLASPEYFSDVEPEYFDGIVRYIDIKPKKDPNTFDEKNTYTKIGLDAFVKEAKQIYLEIDEAIRNNRFAISPLYAFNTTPCTYCPYKDICYVKPNQKRIVVQKKEKADELE